MFRVMGSVDMPRTGLVVAANLHCSIDCAWRGCVGHSRCDSAATRDAIFDRLDPHTGRRRQQLVAAYVSIDVDLRYLRLIANRDLNVGRFGVGFYYPF
jgi:hypothetical protein